MTDRAVAGEDWLSIDRRSLFHMGAITVRLHDWSVILWCAPCYDSRWMAQVHEMANCSACYRSVTACTAREKTKDRACVCLIVCRSCPQVHCLAQRHVTASSVSTTLAQTETYREAYLLVVFLTRYNILLSDRRYMEQSNRARMPIFSRGGADPLLGLWVLWELLWSMKNSWPKNLPCGTMYRPAWLPASSCRNACQKQVRNGQACIRTRIFAVCT